jgi:hypothetical protein
MEKMNLVSRYQYSSFKSQPWEDIELFFRTFFDPPRDKMVELVQHIRASGLDKRLFAGTSLDSLIISIYNDIDRHKDALNIKYDLGANLWRFEYFAKPFQNAEFVRIYPGDKGITKFDNFIKLIGW